ncbi:PREDICTED: signal peptide peptidase-like 2C [Elephantulus edwardii]|uniref:signal peptide peptidase-like 2C n=1 Tax=Elephantulus edwardii TaxID=28737 RepID=UPI0003F05870|nr:PREDICTED: signal peptide peptidase-like 2C [Elephantulus edwardii]
MACLGFLLLVGFLLLLTSTSAQGKYAVVHVVSENWKKDYCVLFSSDYISLPQDLHHAPLLPLHDSTMAPWCPGEDSAHQARPSSPSQQPLRHATAMAMRGNCSLYAEGRLAQVQGAHGLLVVSQASCWQCAETTPDPQDPRQALPPLSIPVVVLRHADMLDILSHTHGSSVVRVALYAPPETLLDYNMLVIFILAVGTVAAGGYWAGLAEADRLQQHQAQGGGGPGGQQPLVAGEAQGRPDGEDEDTGVDFTPAMTGTVVTLSCSVMLLLYFFYDCFVYILIGIFGLGATTGLYSCLAPLASHLPLQLHAWSLPSHQACLQLPLLLLAGLCTTVTALWVAYRNEDSWAWLLQDTLGMAYCLLVLQRVRLPSLKNCASFLLTLLVFDVFYVFVTPFLTRTGESIMVEVALGPAGSLSHEKLPTVLKVPRMRLSALTLCKQPFSILGLGDIVVPGFLVVYCHRFDVQIHSHHVYFIACTLAYAMGLLATFTAVVLTQTGQPALLYLVSCTLVTSLAVAAHRHELTLFWTGQGRAKGPGQPIAGSHQIPSASPEQKQETMANVPMAKKFDETKDERTGALDSSHGEDMAEVVSICDDAMAADGPSDGSEGWSDAILDHDELPAKASEELMPQTPVAMVIPLVPLLPPPPSELGPVHIQAHKASLPWSRLHKRKGCPVRRSMSSQVPL